MLKVESFCGIQTFQVVPTPKKNHDGVIETTIGIYSFSDDSMLGEIYGAEGMKINEFIKTFGEWPIRHLESKEEDKYLTRVTSYKKTRIIDVVLNQDDTIKRAYFIIVGECHGSSKLVGIVDFIE